LPANEWFVRYTDEKGPFIEAVEDIIEAIQGSHSYDHIWSQTVHVQNSDKSAALCIAPSPISVQVDPPCSVFLNRRMIFKYKSI